MTLIHVYPYDEGKNSRHFCRAGGLSNITFPLFYASLCACVCVIASSFPLLFPPLQSCFVMSWLLFYRAGEKEGKHTDIDVWSNGTYIRVSKEVLFQKQFRNRKNQKKYNWLILALNEKKEQIVRATSFTLSHHHHLLLLLYTTVNSILWQLFLFFYHISMRYPWMPSIWWGWSHSHPFSSYIEAEEAPEGPPFPHLFPYIYLY